MSIPEEIIQIKNWLVQNGVAPTLDAAVILGSGLGDFGTHIQQSTVIPYSEIPGFPQSTVVGHSGSLIIGEVSGKKVMAFSGRFHFYEGYPFSKTVVPVQLAKAFDVDKLIISNAAGGINLNFRVGDLMVIERIMHPHVEFDLQQTESWPDELTANSEQVAQIAQAVQVPVKKGSYLYVTGPNYETKAEIRAFRGLGGDAVGMSTAPELMEAYRIGVKAIAVSLITNAAAGVTDQKLDHAEVKEAAELKKDEFAKLVIGLIEGL
jgi:purine-nucleoside phosphorylase